MTTCARDIMTNEVIVARPETTIEEAIKSLVNNRITGMPVVDEERKIIGVVSEFDIIKAVKSVDSGKALNLGRPIEFTRGVISVGEDTPIDEIMNHFVEHAVRRLPVVNAKDQPIGIITRRDIMRMLFYRSKAT